ncbi:MAG: tRNA (guanosine(46)-N7)-methyltransferase TrmB [Candidatus Omnitrophota bacterium]|jgi:tRNA (guanine-N7-)-methyltransferase|nr:MAG: tRNA (guanosine(46)-N7)-methyltransferase TrmB [Candidatus Omnitrophota bacterium]
MCAKTIYHYPAEMESYLIPPGGIDEKLDFEIIFGNTNPVEIEIGTGKGRFILAESLNRPDTNFLGIERSLKFLRIAVLRATQTPRSNCTFLNLDADMVVKLLIRPHSISAYHVYFPDPWPKGRHQKRRLFNPRFLEKMAETLIDKGLLHVKTDHADYFSYANESIQQSGRFDLLDHSLSHEILSHIDEAPDTATHYEIKFRKEERQIYSAIFQALNSRPSA